MEEYCWATTQVTVLSHWGLSSSSVLEFGFKLDFLAYTYIFDHMRGTYSSPT